MLSMLSMLSMLWVRWLANPGAPVRLVSRAE
jgi:hypothetical protein